MSITNQHVSGFMFGVGTAAAAYYLYRQNQDQVDEFLLNQGINMPAAPQKDLSKLSLEDLVKEKEQLEDIIAEREHEAKSAKK